MSGLLDNVLGTLMQEKVTEKIADNFGIEKSKAQTVLSTALPILMQALKKNASTPEGEKRLDNVLEKDHDPSIIDNVTDYLSNPKTDEGNKILNHILGGKRKTVEQLVANDSGLDSGMVGNLLSTAAPILMGALASTKKNSNNNIGNILGEITGEMQNKSGKDQNMIEKLLDQNNDGSIVDDITNMGTSLLGNMFKK